MKSKMKSEIQHESPRCPNLPPEIWEMIINYLLIDLHPRGLQGLACVARAFYKRLNWMLYKTVLLFSSHESALFTRTLQERPHLRTLVQEVRHDDDTGCKIYSDDSVAFYQVLSQLPNLESLVMRMRTSACKEDLDELDRVKPFEFLMRKTGHGELPPKWGKFLFPQSITDGLVFEDLKQALWFQSRLPDVLALPALRSCHIGSDYLSDQAQIGEAVFIEPLFWHPALEKICITNSVFESETLIWRSKLRPHRRGISAKQWPQDQASDVNDFSDALAPQKSSLESIDMDIYWGDETWSNLRSFTSLTCLTVTPYTLTGSWEGEHIFTSLDDVTFPYSLENFTLRWEEDEGTEEPFSQMLEKLDNGHLPNLKDFTIELPLLSSHYDYPMECIDEDSFNLFNERFERRGVHLHVPDVCYLDFIPSYDICSCEHMEYYHRFPEHRAEEWLDDKYPHWESIPPSLTLGEMADDLARWEVARDEESNIFDLEGLPPNSHADLLLKHIRGRLSDEMMATLRRFT
ncbi:hypothetical protein N7520_006557 [Penicillium odoratum]|uniref:uncharacterized protein n=1 Tax=Penicillium odoratum TaxID=1167516 RepID=UPI0025467515|nr:uncharacterized protein N7520_006557 [Penicillium odoratum]KAJ5759401.1 hypothetical protein N7520_006557 [Penicillium odoratum]